MATAKTVETAKSAKVETVKAEIKIVGQGTLSGSRGGLPFYLVTSQSEPGRVHCVVYAYEGAYVGARVHCDCVAASYGKSCKHVLVVREQLENGWHITPRGRKALERLQASRETPEASVTPDVSNSFSCRPPRLAPSGAKPRRQPDTCTAADAGILRRSQEPFSLMAK